MQISSNKVVSFSYKLTDSDGELIDETPKGESFPYLHGHQNIVPGLEKQLEGLKKGDAITAKVLAGEAYGEFDEELIFQVPRSNFPKELTIVEGMEFDSDGPEGPMTVVVTNVDKDLITVNANHPLAGVDLTFDIKITDVREATPQEIAHGHVHQGGHDH